jgi:hypothetical protein
VLEAGLHVVRDLSRVLDGRNLIDKRHVSNLGTIQNARAAGANMAPCIRGRSAGEFPGPRSRMIGLGHQARWAGVRRNNQTMPGALQRPAVLLRNRTASPRLCTATGTIGLHERHWSIGMNNIIYIVGLVVVVIAVLSFFGLR